MAFVGYLSSAGARQGAAAGGPMIYFDNAATSWPKPPGVAEAMTHFIEAVGANPGRAAHRQAVESGRIVYGA